MAATFAKQRVYSLDVLKFVAICIIAFHHYQQIVGVEFSSGINWFGGSFYWGNLVELFFILSGIFAYKSAMRIGSDTMFFDWYSRKYVRFFPLMVVAGVACLVTNCVYVRHFGLGGFPFSLWTIFASMLGVSRWLDTSSMVNNPVWYISVLLLCFIYLFAITKLCRRWGIKPLVGYVLLVAFGMIMDYICNEYKIIFPFFNNSISRGLITFFLGVLLCRPMKVLSEKHGWRTFWIALVTLIGFCLLYAARPEVVAKASYSLRYTLYFIVFPLTVLLFCSCPMRRLFDLPKLGNVGNVAYSMYMWHLPLLYAFTVAFSALDVPITSRMGMWGFLMLCIGVGILSNKLLEPPLNGVASRAMDRVRALLED